MAEDRLNINFGTEGLDKLTQRLEEMRRSFERLTDAQRETYRFYTSQAAPQPPRPGAPGGTGTAFPRPPTPSTGDAYRFYTPRRAPEPPSTAAYTPYSAPPFSPYTPAAFSSWSRGPFSPWVPPAAPPQAPFSPYYAPGFSPWSAPPGTPPWGPSGPATSSGGYRRPPAPFSPWSAPAFSPWSPPAPPPPPPFSPWTPGAGGAPFSPWSPPAGPAAGPGVASSSGGYGRGGGTPAQTAVQNLARLNLEAFRTYNTLQTLGARNRDQGFLGRQDMQQWERATQHWKQFEREAAHTVAHAQQHLVDVQAQPGTPRAMALGIARAQAGVDRAIATRNAFAQLGAAFGGSPPTPGGLDDPDAPEDARRPGMFARGFASFQHAMRQARDLALGVSVAGVVQHGMHLADQRARGITQIGMLTGQPFGAIGAQLDALRAGGLHMRAEDILRAQLAYGRLAGTTAGPGLENALIFGTAQGMDPVRAAQMSVLAGRMTTGPLPLTTALGVFRQQTNMRRGTLSGAELAEETLGMAEQTARRGIQLPTAFFGRFQGMLTEQNPDLMQVPGMMQQRFGQMQQGLAATSNDLILAEKMRAVATLAAENRARGRSNVYRVGGVDIPIDTTWGMKTAIEEAGSLPDVANAIIKHGKEMAGNDPNLQRMLYQRYTMSGQVSNLQAEQDRLGLQKAGGYPSTADDPRARAQQRASDAAGILLRNEDPNFKNFERRRVAAEKGLEVVGGEFLSTILDLQEAIGKTAVGFNEGLLSGIGGMIKAIAELDSKTWTLVGAFQALSAQSITGVLTGLGMVGVGLMGNDKGIPSLDPGAGVSQYMPWNFQRFYLQKTNPVGQQP